MGKIDLDKHWPLPPYSPSAALRAACPPGLASSGHDDHLPGEDASGEAAGALAAKDWDALFEPAPSAAPELSTGTEQETVGAPPLATAPAEPSSPAKRSFAPVVWSGLGFVVGMLAWHVVGFWTFMSDVVLNDHANEPQALLESPTSAAEGQEKPAFAPPVRVIAAAAVDPTACVALAIDRGAGMTAKAPCTRQETEMRDAGFRRRTDRATAQPRMQDPVAWSGSTAVNSSLETGTLQASDFNLNLDRVAAPD